MRGLPGAAWRYGQNTRFDNGRLLVSTSTVDNWVVITSASSRFFTRCMGATGARLSRLGNDTRLRMYGMGEVIRLEDRRARLRPDAVVGDPVRAEFLFDLGSPFTYLAAERVDRAFDAVAWTPACARTLRCRAVPANER